MRKKGGRVNTAEPQVIVDYTSSNILEQLMRSDGSSREAIKEGVAPIRGEMINV